MSTKRYLLTLFRKMHSKLPYQLFGFTELKDLRLRVDLLFKVISRLSLIRMTLMLLLLPL